MTAHSENIVNPAAIDHLTGGAISASTALARAQLIKHWLESSPPPSYEQMSEVFKLLSAKDKGAARQVKDSMDLIKKALNQEALIAHWSDKANILLGTHKLNLADAMAWQRDAAKEGAPISKEPLASLRSSLAERVKTIEDLQHRAQVQREAAVLLSQRIEVLSTKYWEEAQSLEAALQEDVQRWRSEQETLLNQKDWINVDPKYAPALNTSAEHLQIVWEAFSAALKQAALCASEPQQALPAVPAWADQIKQKRVESGASEKSTQDAPNAKHKKPAKAEIDPVLKAQAKQALQLSMSVLEKELGEGHGKASAGAAADLRQVLKVHTNLIDDRLEKQAQILLSAAGELEGWQRWRADQLRAELVAKAEGLLQRVKPSVEVKGNRPVKGAQPRVRAHDNEKTDRSEAAAELAKDSELVAVNEVDKVSEHTHQTYEAEQNNNSQPRNIDALVSQQTSSTDATLERTSIAAAANEAAANTDLITDLITDPIIQAEPNDEPQLKHAASSVGQDGNTPHKPTELSNLDPSDAQTTQKSAPNPDYVPTMGPRKLQETLRKLREDWKQTDQGGMANHALWKRFDNACNLAYPFVQEWLQQTRAQSQANRAQRLKVIEEVKAWTAEHSNGPDWRGVQRQLHDFSEKWRACGHVSEKVFSELQSLWKEAIQAAHKPIETLQNESILRRKALIEESKSIGSQPTLRIDLIKAVQQRWQDESHVVPIDRKLAQRLWDDFKKPLDEAFQRKSAERAQIAQSMSAHDEAVLKASRALEQAIQDGDASKIKAAVQYLQQVTISGEPAQVKVAPLNTATLSPDVVDKGPTHVISAHDSTDDSTLDSNDDATSASASASGAQLGTQIGASDTLKPTTDFSIEDQSPNTTHLSTDDPSKGHPNDTDTQTPQNPQIAPVDSAPSTLSEDSGQLPQEPVSAQPALPKPAKIVVAVRGDDRPGARRADSHSLQEGRSRSGPGGGGPGRGKDTRDSKGGRGGFGASSGGGARDSRDSRDSRAPRENRDFIEPRGPRLGDAAFRAQRQALEAAELAMRKLAAQAHGQTLTNLMNAWQDKKPELVPTLKELGPRVSANQRANWVKAIGQTGAKQSADSLLRLEMAADAPTPASDLQARRNLQLQMLTKRNDPTPAQTWAEDTAAVFAGPFETEVARRLQSALKTLLKL